MRVLVSWSSGKDSAWALHRLRGQPELEVAGLVTTVNTRFERVAASGARIESETPHTARANPARCRAISLRTAYFVRTGRAWIG